MGRSSSFATSTGTPKRVSDPLVRALAERVRGPVTDRDAVPAEFRSNFGHLVDAAPRALLRPASVEDVIETVRFARSKGLHVATRGA